MKVEVEDRPSTDLLSTLKNFKLSEEQLIAFVARESFYEFVKEFWGVLNQEEFTDNWHIRLICHTLQRVAERVERSQPKKYDLIINIPPGMTKSTICSQMFPAWVWTRFPWARFVCVSYSQQIALKDSIRTRDIVISSKYRQCFPEVKIRQDESAKGLFANTHGGYRYAAGVGGSITGYHGHFLIVDDPLNPEKSYSDTELHNVDRWMRHTLSSRKINREVTPIILIHQRLHQLDPTGKILERTEGEGIKHLCLPAELTEDVSPSSVRKFYKEGLLDPIRLPRHVLDETLKEMGEYGYSSQMLQRPVPLSGGLFKVEKIKIESEAPRIVQFVRSWDKAGTEMGGAYSVGVLLGLDADERYWILDVVRGQWDAATREQIIKMTAEVDGKKTWIVIEAEGGSGGKESAENTIRNLAGYKVTAVHPTGDKIARAYPLASQVGAGNVYVLNRNWTADFIEELRYFPNSRYKDQVDAVSQGFNFLARPRPIVGGWGALRKKGNVWRGRRIGVV